MSLAEKLAPNDVDLHWRLGRLYRATGKKAEAEAEFDKAKSITLASDAAKMTPESGKALLPVSQSR